jgi:hypothetical protein
MADLSITAASVKPSAGAVITSGIAGATITAGQLVHRNTTSGKFVLSDADGSGLKQVLGVALNGASDGQPLSVQTGGDITIGATVTAGTTYYASPTAGGICPLADVASGDDPIIIGIAKSASVLMLRIADPDVTI